ncbi:MAG: NAD-dependent epimerase/dehydratase family protein [Candidatus Didemnitutus sp.]|nr:NAD-dependent epimerase/dehydratase family protein [Candidatus Didemnitutus sp.]
MTPFPVKRAAIFGCGYVGTALAVALRVRGVAVVALTRNRDRAAELNTLGIETIIADLADHSWHAQLGDEVGAAICTVSAAAPTPEGYRQSYVNGLQSVLTWTKRRAEPLASLLYTSSTGVYAQSGGATVDESAPTEPTSPTGRILAEAEALLPRASPKVRRWFVLRLAGIYGPGRHYLLNALRAGQTAFPGEPHVRLNLIHRDDVVGALLACLAAPEMGRSDTFNLSDGHPATKGEVVTWLAGQLSVAPPTFGDAAVARTRRGEPTPDRVIANAKIRRVMGWAPTYPDYRAGYAALLRQL